MTLNCEAVKDFDMGECCGWCHASNQDHDRARYYVPLTFKHSAGHVETAHVCCIAAIVAAENWVDVNWKWTKTKTDNRMANDNESQNHIKDESNYGGRIGQQQTDIGPR